MVTNYVLFATRARLRSSVCSCARRVGRGPEANRTHSPTTPLHSPVSKPFWGLLSLAFLRFRAGTVPGSGASSSGRGVLHLRTLPRRFCTPHFLFGHCQPGSEARAFVAWACALFWCKASRGSGYPSAAPADAQPTDKDQLRASRRLLLVYHKLQNCCTSPFSGWTVPQHLLQTQLPEGSPTPPALLGAPSVLVVRIGRVRESARLQAHSLGLCRSVLCGPYTAPLSLERLPIESPPDSPLIIAAASARKRLLCTFRGPPPEDSPASKPIHSVVTPIHSLAASL